MRLHEYTFSFTPHNVTLVKAIFYIIVQLKYWVLLLSSIHSIVTLLIGSTLFFSALNC